MFRKVLVAGALAFGLFAGGASAADIKGPAYKAPPPVFDWSGWYGGVDVGYITSDTSAFIPGGGSFTANPDPDGFVGGVHLGYRKQFPSKLVLGIEADFWGTNADGVAFYQPAGGAFAPVDFNWGGSVRAVVGVAMSPTLLYATGGVAFIDYDGCGTGTLGGPCVATSNFSNTQFGWTAGLGLARAFTPRMIARIEYLYADYGDKTFITPVTNGGTTTIDLQTHTIRGGISWRFTTR